MTLEWEVTNARRMRIVAKGLHLVQEAEGTADFQVNNNKVEIGDVVVVSVRSGSNGGGTIVSVTGVAAVSFTIRVHNGNDAAGTAETGAIVINFVVIKAVSA